MSGRRRLGIAAAVAGVALIGFLVVRHAGLGPAAGSASSPVGRTMAGAAFAPPPGPLPQPAPNRNAPPDAAPPALTSVGAARALAAINKNEQTRRLFLRLQPLGLSPEQRDSVLLILGTQALRPAEESPTLRALRASDGGSRVLSEDDAKRVRAERQQIEERLLNALRPSLAAVLTPAQMAQAGLDGGGRAKVE